MKLFKKIAPSLSKNDFLGGFLSRTFCSHLGHANGGLSILDEDDMFNGLIFKRFSLNGGVLMLFVEESFCGSFYPITLAFITEERWGMKK
jgi:hypothetical protein